MTCNGLNEMAFHKWDTSGIKIPTITSDYVVQQTVKSMNERKNEYDETGSSIIHKKISETIRNFLKYFYIGNTIFRSSN